MVETYSEGGGIIQYTKYEDRVDLGVYGIITGNRLDIGGTIPTPNQLRGLCDRLGIGELIIAGEYGLILDGFEIQCLGPTPRSQPNIGYKVYSCGDIRHIRKEIL